MKRDRACMPCRCTRQHASLSPALSTNATHSSVEFGFVLRGAFFSANALSEARTHGHERKWPRNASEMVRETEPHPAQSSGPPCTDHVALGAATGTIECIVHYMLLAVECRRICERTGGSQCIDSWLMKMLDR